MASDPAAPPVRETRILSPALSESREIATHRTPPVEQLFATIVEAAFDLIDELGHISLLLYLHAPHKDQPVLFLRSPQLSTLDPSETFRLMHTVTMLSNGRKPTAAFRHGDLDGHYVRSSGPKSDGLFVFGGIQGAETARRITSVAQAFSRVLHQFHLDDDPDVTNASAPIISLGTDGGGIRIEATVRRDGRYSIGRATAAHPNEAVARAVMDAIAPLYEFDEIRTLDLGRRSAVLAVLRDERRFLRLGLAISAGDLLRTTALATQRAILSASS